MNYSHEECAREQQCLSSITAITGAAYDRETLLEAVKPRTVRENKHKAFCLSLTETAGK